MAADGQSEYPFFIYDHEVLKKEEDDPNDAIIYFYPPMTPINDRCSLCGQLMGLVRFFADFAGAPPVIYRLRLSQYVLLHQGKYTFALGGDPDLPACVLQRQLDFVYRLFVLYHKNIDDVSELCNAQDRDFGDYLSIIWNTYVPYMRYYGDDFLAAMQPVQSVSLAKGEASLFLKASHLLEMCKRVPGVFAGCLLLRNRVLCTQLTPDFTARMALVRPHQTHLPCRAVKTDFTLPVGVRLLCIYVTEEEYNSFMRTCSEWPNEKHVCESRFYETQSGAFSEPGKPDQSEKKLTSNKRVSTTDSVDNTSEGDNNLESGAMETSDSDKLVVAGSSSPSPLDEGTESNVDKMGDSDSKEGPPVLSLDAVEVTTPEKPEIEPVGKGGNISEHFTPHIGPDPMPVICTQSALEAFAEQVSVSIISDVVGNFNVRDSVELEDLERNLNEADVLPTVLRQDKTSNDDPECITSDLSHNSIEKKNSTQMNLTVAEDVTVDVKDDSMDTTGNILRESTESEKEPMYNQGPPTDSDRSPHKNLSSNKKKVLENSEVKASTSSSNSPRPGEIPQVTLIPATKVQLFKAVKAASKTALKNYESRTSKQKPTENNSASLLIESSVKSLPSPSTKDLETYSTSSIASPREEPVFDSDRHVPKHPTSEKSDLSSDGSKGKSAEEPMQGIQKLEITKRSESPESPQISLTDSLKSPSKVCPLVEETPVVPEASRPPDEIEELDLYIQGNADLLLLLIMEKGSGQYKDIVHALWKAALPQLGEMDLFINQRAIRGSSPKKPDAEYNYLMYNGLQKTLKGNMLQPVSSNENSFIKTAVDMHGDFSKSQELTDIILRSNQSYVYGHRAGYQETYFHQQNSARFSTGLPNDHDLNIAVDETAYKKLYLKEKIVII